MERVLRWYTGYLEERGTVADVPEWNPLDWASVFVSGRSSILTALWARGGFLGSGSRLYVDDILMDNAGRQPRRSRRPARSSPAWLRGTAGTHRLIS